MKGVRGDSKGRSRGACGVERRTARRIRGFEQLESRTLLDGSGGLLPLTSGVPVPDFSLIDVNTTSSTYNQAVSPRDYVGTMTGWYFGHAT